MPVFPNNAPSRKSDYAARVQRVASTGITACWLYTNVTLEQNAKGCMKPFVKNKVWKRIMALPPMWCPILEKPILDLKVYTKNR